MKTVPSFFSILSLACAAVFFSAPCAVIADVSPEAQVGEVHVHGLSLALSETQGMCQLTSKKGKNIHTQPLDMQWPCAFHLDLASAVRIQKSGTASYIIVESVKRNEASSKDCQTSLKSVRIQKSKAEVSKSTAQVTSCPPFQWDSYVFTELF